MLVQPISREILERYINKATNLTIYSYLGTLDERIDKGLNALNIEHIYINEREHNTKCRQLIDLIDSIDIEMCNAYLNEYNTISNVQILGTKGNITIYFIF